MKLLLVDQFGEMGGAQRCLLEAAMGFADRGWEVRILVPPGPIHKALEPYCIEVRTLTCGPYTSASKTIGDAGRFALQLPRQAAEIARTARRNSIDVIYVNGPRVLPGAALGRAGRPLVYHAHWMVPQNSAAFLAREALRRSGASAIATSGFAAQWLRAAVKPGLISTIYNGVSGFGVSPRNRDSIRTSGFAAQWLRAAVKPGLISTIYNGVSGFGVSPRNRDSIRHIAILGRISPEKGQLEFVRAARIATQRNRSLRFTVCGASMFSADQYFQQVRAEAAGLPVEFHEWTENVGAFLAGVDLLVVPSQPIDNIPRVILEAFASGAPVLAFASGAIPELIQHGETGLLVRHQAPETLAEAILSAAGDCDLLNQIAARSYQRWQERYTLRRFQSEICDAVEAASRRHFQRTPFASAGASAPA